MNLKITVGSKNHWIKLHLKFVICIPAPVYRLEFLNLVQFYDDSQSLPRKNRKYFVSNTTLVRCTFYNSEKLKVKLKLKLKFKKFKNFKNFVSISTKKAIPGPVGSSTRFVGTLLGMYSTYNTWRICQQANLYLRVSGQKIKHLNRVYRYIFLYILVKKFFKPTPKKIVGEANPGSPQRRIGKLDRSRCTRCTRLSHSTEYTGQSAWRRGGTCIVGIFLTRNKCNNLIVYIIRSEHIVIINLVRRYVYAPFAEHIQEFSFRAGLSPQVIQGVEGASTVSFMSKLNQNGRE